MKQIISGSCCLLLAFCVYTSCKKMETIKETGSNQTLSDASKKQDPLIAAILSKVNNAKLFFEAKITKQDLPFNQTKSNIAIKTRQQVGKTALWERAYIGQTKSKGDVVIVPLKYDRPMEMVTSFGNGKETPIEARSNLWVYKDAHNNYVAAVITVLPDKKSQDGDGKIFSGYILEEDWAGNNMKTHSVKDGKAYTRKKKTGTSGSSNTASRQVCDAINWYLCDVDNNGNHTNCIFQFTEIIRCYDDEDIQYDDFDDEGLGAGSIEDIVSTAMATTKSWTVCSDAYATVLAQEVIKGVRSFANSATKYNHFTSISPGSPIFTNNLFYSVYTQGANPPYTAYPTTWGFVEGAHGNSLDSTTVGSAVSCNYSQQDVLINPGSHGTYTTIPVGSSYIQLKPNSKYWGFYEVF